MAKGRKPKRKQPDNLVELLRGRAAEEPARGGYTFLGDNGSEESLSFADLDERARAIAARLGEQARPGDRALLLYPPGLDFIAAFFGCLYAGVVAVPAYPPLSAHGFPRLLALAGDARPAVALTTSNLLRRLAAAGAEVPQLAALPCLATDGIAPDAAGAWRAPVIGGETLAFLQYTSGSTAAPKGVMVSHGNLLHNEEMIRQAFGMSGDSLVVGWLPLYHDMGLIGNVLQPLYAGARCALMSPAAFLQQPLRWLEAISRFRATTSGGPNFAYELCTRKIGPEQRERLDLSCWTVAFNGAEPVRADTMERFARTFAPCGFRREAFYPCYGLAEATLFVAGAGPQEAPAVVELDATALERGEAVDAGERGGRALVGCGRAWLKQVVLVVDPETGRPVADGRVGEIWVAGPSVAQGYWKQPAATQEEFRARTDGGPEGPFLRTGDLGFLRAGELFVTGRRKDLIILRGRNLYPQDVELACERSHPALRPGCAAAFAVEVEGEERLVVVQEVDRRFQGDPAELVVAIRQAVAEAHEAQVHAVALIKTGTIPKTSSGKVQRRACRDLFLKGRLDTVHTASLSPAQPGAGEDGEVLAFLRDQVARLAGIPRAAVDVARPVTALGLDSLGAVELSHRVEERFGLLLPLAALLEGPRLAEVAEWIAKAPAAAAERIESAGEEEGDQPLSHGQKALWFLYRLDPQDAAYNVAAALRVQGPLDVDALEQAVGLVTRRHSSVRSSFHAGPDGPVRRVHRRRNAEVLTLDAAGWSAGELDDRLHQEAWRPFDLESDPLLRLAVFRLSAGEHVLLITVHHIVSDLWSLAVLKRDLDAAYRALSGEAVQIPATPRLRHADHVRWQERRLAGPEGERLWEFWRQRLAGELPETTLPAERPQGARPAKRGGSLTAFLDAETGERLRRLAREGNTTLSTILLTGFLALLQRYTGQEDLLVGVPTDGRDRPELADLVGYLVNPVVIRADAGGNPSLAALLARVRTASLSAFEHREMPFPLLVERLQPVRDASRPPLFQTLFVFQRSPAEAAVDLGPFALGAAGARTQLAGMTAQSVALESRAARFDLELVTAELGAQVGLSLRYDAGRFAAASMERLLGHYRNLLAGAAAEPGQTLAELPLLSPADLRQLLVDLNRTGEVAADGATLHGLFLDQARRTPDATAVMAGDRCISYRELAEKTARLAGFLLARGVGPEEPVAVCLERGVELVAALLGVMAAGGAYVPIDPRYPHERQEYLLEDSGARLLLTRAGLGAAGARAIAPEAWQDWPEKEASRCLPAGLAYLIYTSGSTGRPKAVAIEHGSAAALVRWALDLFAPAALARTLATTSVCFDLSVFELFVPLACGGAVVLVEDALAVPAAARHEPTLLNTVPSALAELLRQGGLPASVRTVNLAGEPLPRALVEAAYGTGTVERVFNLYGPSEDTTYSTWALVPPGSGLPVTIGRPLPGSQAYVLDARGNPVPFGAIGELYLGGAGLARGYFRRPALTAERFVPDPFAGEPGRRLYRTGDRVRWRLDGEIEFLGRVDHQIKVRGFRIEPGEIEAELRALPGVRDAVVVVREDRSEGGPGERRLVAYVAGEIAAEELRRSLRERLPDYMVPAAFVVLEALPLTPNGKVDRKALPAPEIGGGAGAAPRNQVEELLAGLWAEVLHVERVGIHDNFFALGGHSLLATRLVSRIREALGVELPVRTVFVSPTVADLAGTVATAARAALPPIARAPRGGPLPQSFAQQRLWFIHQLDPASPSYNMPCAVRLAGALRPAALAAALGEIVRRHEVLRTTFAILDGQPVQSIAPPPPIAQLALPRVDLTGLAADRREAEAARLAGEEARRPFDLGRGPLLRSFLVMGSAEEHVLVLVLHHIVADGWSIGVLAHELGSLYSAFAAGRPSPLPELPVQYADFACWQRRWLADEGGEEQLSYWRRQLAGLPDGLDLPLDRPRPALPTLAGGLRVRDFPDDLRLALHRLGREQGATLFMVALAAFATLLSRLTRQNDVVMGSPIANRNRIEIEGLIGFFVNTLVLRVDTAGPPTFAGLVERAREVALGATACQDVPFERLVEEMAPERNLERTPLFQVVLVVQNAPSETLTLPGLSLQVLPLHTGTANFDLTLTLSEEEGVLRGSLEHKTALFDESTVERFLGHLLTLTGAAVADPDAPISRLPLLDAAERRQLVAQALAGVRPFPADVPLHRLFERQAARTPQAVAVVGEAERLTYAELDERAGRLAARLRRLGVGPEVRVALWLERTAELVVAILGVLKAGGAYVPIDPSYPEDRLRFLLEDAGAPVLVSVAELRGRLGLDGVATVLLDRPAEEGEPAVALATPDLPESTAYVIYTSGSTGRPKGVPVSHANVARLFTATAGWFGFGEGDVWTLFHSCAFDFSVWELWGALLHGGRLVVMPYWVSRSPEAFCDLLVRERVTVLNQTPSAFYQLAAAEAQRERPDGLALRWVIFGGEALEPRRLAGWFARHGDRRPALVNMYGITETTVHVTFRPLVQGDLERGSVIGVPIPDLWLHVLDGEREPVPLGVAGEIHVGGAGLARGYLGRPDLTAERFVPDPFASWPGARLYASGDLARRRPDGELEYLGRADQQVKIRGFRIEPGEIESALAQHPAVREAVVLAREGEGGRRLVAWLGVGSDPAPGADELRAFLKARLPEHMIPAAFVPLPTLPLTAHGKVDRRALPEPEAVRPGLSAEYVAPRVPEETTLAAVWAEVLGVDRVGVHDNFFALGGDSIRSIRVLALAEARGLRFSLPQLFQHQTIAELIPHRLAASTRVSASTPFALVTAAERAALPQDVEDAYPLSALQLGMLFHSDYGESAALYHVAHSMRLSRRLDVETLRAAAARLAERHPVLRTSFDLVGRGRPLQLVHRAVAIPVTGEDLSALAPAEQEAAIARRFAQERARGFGWDRPPLLRFHVQDLGGGGTQLFLTEHHVILDGWSQAVMLSELFHLCRAEPAATSLPPAPVSTFRELVALEREALESEEAREFWAQRLRDAEPARLLPWHPEEEDKDRTPLAAHVPGPVLAGLRELAGAAGVPLKNVLLAAHVWVVGRVTGTRDVITGLVTNGRPEAADADRILGLFLNTVPLRAPLAAGTWTDLVRRMLAAERELLPFRRYPLPEIQREMGATGAAQLFDTSFNYVHFHVLRESAEAFGISLAGIQAYSETNIPLAVDFVQDSAEEALLLSAQRDPERVNQDQLLAIVDLYLRVLAAMAAQPLARYDTADLLSPAERQQILHQWNDTDLAGHLESEVVHEVFERWAAVAPEAPALLSSQGELTYRELNRRANRIARRLQSAGAGPEVTVGLYVERSPEMIAGLLGILKAGAAYVPLDPAYPRERLLLMIEDVQMPLALAQERLAGGLAGLVGEVIAIDGLGEIGPEDEANPQSGVVGDNLAYAIFTSGSTGRPKPVGVSHRALTRHMAGTREVLRMAEHTNDRVLQFSTLNFDGSVDQVFIALVNGGCLALREEEMWSAGELEERIGQMGLTIIDLPTGYWSEWVRARSAAPERPEGETLRVVYVGGEAMLSEELEVWWRSPRNRNVRLLNAYGPTETVVAASYLEATSRESAGPLFERVAIGHPLGGRALHVVDPDLRAAPVGVAGELLIAGEPILARGYLGRPDLTAERFLPDPFSAVPGARLYRTGDLGRYLPDGRREFLGRVDDQVKVRGFRIELGEVEAALAEHPAVHRAAAVVHGKSRSRRLVAYVTPAADGREALGAADLRAFLRGKLPEPMVPSDVVLLDRLPLTPNGKVDRRALPAPELTAQRDGGPVQAPRSDVELQLVGIWEELLGVSPVGVADDFLELGGHSLLAVRLMARIEHVFGVKLPIAALFEAPTVERLAGLLQDGEAAVRHSPLVRLHPGGAGRPLFVVHPVGGEVFAYVELARQLGNERPVYGLQAIARPGESDGHLPTMEELAAQYLAAVRQVQAQGPWLLAGWSLGAVIAYEMVQQIERAGGSVALLAMIDPSSPAQERRDGIDETALLTGFAGDLVRLSGRQVALGPEVLSGLGIEAGIDRLLELGRSEGVLPPDVDQARLRERFDRFSRHVKALYGYTPLPYGGRVALFRAAASLSPEEKDAAAGWSALTRADVHVFDADHYTLLQRPALDRLVEQLRRDLALAVEAEDGEAWAADEREGGRTMAVG